MTDSPPANESYTLCDHSLTLGGCMKMRQRRKQQPTLAEPTALQDQTRTPTTLLSIWLVRASRHQPESGHTGPECSFGLKVTFNPPVLVFYLVQLILIEPYEP